MEPTKPSSQGHNHFEHQVRADAPVLNLEAKELWQSRDMLFFLVLRDFKIRFKQSYLGISWALLQPLATTLVFTAVMGGVINISFDGPYPLYFLSGLIPWNYFSKVFGNGTLSLVNEADLIRKVYFPRLILPLYQSISVLSDVAIAFLILLGLYAYYGWLPNWQILCLPIFLCLSMMFGTAISLWLGPINVRFRDIQIVLPLITQLMFIATPVMYPSHMVLDGPNTWISFIYSLNPMLWIVEGFRWSLLGVGQPFTIMALVSYTGVIVLSLTGVMFFNHSQRKFADVI